MKYFFAFMIGFVSLSGYGQDFYDMDEIQTIEITFAESNWDQLLDIAYVNETVYILAQSVAINGEVFDSVGVKYKGNSTYNSNRTKNPFHIELDTYKSHNYQGYKDIKLSNVDKDPSFLREVLSYYILRKYMVGPQSNYANVYVNGDLLGLYTNSESITKTFTQSYFGSKGNTFIKCNPPEGAGPQANNFPNLEYLGEDSTNYYDAYELKTETGWSDLIDLCDTLENNLDAIESILDVDKTLWMLAYNNVLVNLDSYIGAFSQNYYLYKDDFGRFLPVVWDLNESFGRFSQTGSSNLNSTTAKQQMSHLLHQNDSDFPLLQQLLSVPMYKRMYLAHFKTILLENFENGDYYDVALTLKELIDADVLNDDNKIFSYANFLSNLDNDVNAGGGGGPMGGNVPGIANLMEDRLNYLLGLSDLSAGEPIISNVGASVAQPIIGETMFITAEVLNGETVYLGGRNDFYVPFERIQMFDDGLHGDGAAGDGIFGAEVAIENAFLHYYVYAENENIGKFSPQRAEHEYHTITATVTDPSVGDLVINEFLASNDASDADQDGEYDDWLEIYNNSQESIDLTGYFLSDDASELMQWEFPAGIVIEGGGYIVVWADDDTDQEGLHASYKISASAESLFLVNPDGEILDEVSFTDQQTDVSYGRFPNGTGEFTTMSPTIGAENMLVTNTIESNEEDGGFLLYPNPTRNSIYIDVQDAEEHEMIIYNLQGQIMFSLQVRDEVVIDVSNWNAGIYLVKCNNKSQKLSIH